MTDDTILDCGHTPSEHGPHTTGTAHTPDGREICWQCAGNEERAAMIESGNGTMYTTKKDGKWRVTNWPNTLSFPIGTISTGRHNIAGKQVHFWFRGPDKAIWHGIQWGSAPWEHSTGLSDGYYCRVYRTKYTD